MTTDAFANLMLEELDLGSDPRAEKVQVFMDRMLLRIFSAPGLLSKLRDRNLTVNEDSAVIELDFSQLPNQILSDVMSLIGTKGDPESKVDVVQFDKDGLSHTGVRVTRPLKAFEDKDDND